jgi:hypothetical protein
MSLPTKRHEASPVTGKSSPKAEEPAAVEPDSTATPSAPDSEDADLELPESVFRRRTTQVPDAQPVPNYGAATPKDLNPPPEDTKEVRDRQRKKNNPLEKKNALKSGDAKFTRFVTRPETAFAAHAAIENSRSESPVSTDRVAQDHMSFGKQHRTVSAAPAYRPNKLFSVLDSIYTHSPLKWLDATDRAGPRFILGFLLLAIAGGGLAWIYIKSLSTSAQTAGGEKEAVKLSAGERVERAKLAVQNLSQTLAGAQNIEARIALVSDPDRAREKMEKYYGEQQGTDPKIVSWNVGSPVTGPQGDYLPLTIEDSTGTTITIVMEETGEGVRIDWENFVGYGEQNWQDYCTRRPIPPSAMRVRMRKSEHYEGIYNKTKWQAYDLEHRSGPPALTGYVLRSERISQTLNDLCNDDQWHTANVYLRFESGAGGDRLVNIDDIIPTRWQDQAVKWTRRE